MQQCWIFVYVIATIMAINGHVQDLRVNVIPIQSRFAAAQNVNVILKYTNVGSDTMSIYKWYLPEKELFDPLFEVTLDGQSVEYVGPLAKRRAPTAEDVISLSPGMTVSSFVQLSSVYNMTQSGNYIIQYKMNANQVLLPMENTIQQRTMLSNDDQESTLESPPIVVFAVGRRNLLIEEAIEANSRVRALAPTYYGCSASQTNSIRSALTAAESYANTALQYVNAQAGTTVRYTTWYGTFSATNRLTLKSHLTKIQSAVSSQTLSFDCTCPAAGPGTYAYVYPNQHYKIYLCGAFWPSSITGTDSMGGTIIHELAHFQILSGTSDHAYGQGACKSLAQTSPLKALANSDSLQYFVENNPRLN